MGKGRLTAKEAAVYEFLCAAADAGQPCPLNLDIEDLVDCSSTSMGAKIVANLEQKGFIRVRRYQRFREVQICATGKWTMKHPMQKTARKHIPRGAGSAAGVVAKNARSM